MKITKTFTINLELAEALEKEKNASRLINDLLQVYYTKKEYKELTPDEIEAQIFTTEQKVEALKRIKLRQDVEREKLEEDAKKKKELEEINRKSLEEYKKSMQVLIPENDNDEKKEIDEIFNAKPIQ